MRFLYLAILSLCYYQTCVNGIKLAPTTRLNNGYDIPLVGFGTYAITGAQCEQAVKDAIDVGYRHIDTAMLYGNEREVGNAIRAKISEGVVKREDIFVTTKLWNTFHSPDQVQLAFQKSFENLGLDYIDLYLIHSPTSYKRVSNDGSNRIPSSIEDTNLFPRDEYGHVLLDNIDYVQTWTEMEKLLATGHVRSIGVSNFDVQQMERLNSANVKPVTNQIESNPNHNQLSVIQYCLARNISVTAYSPLGGPHSGNGKQLALSDPHVKQIATKYNKSPAQVILRYSIQNGAIVIPKSSHKNRMIENIDIFDFELNANEMAYLNSLNGK